MRQPTIEEIVKEFPHLHHEMVTAWVENGDAYLMQIKEKQVYYGFRWDLRFSLNSITINSTENLMPNFKDVV